LLFPPLHFYHQLPVPREHRPFQQNAQNQRQKAGAQQENQRGHRHSTAPPIGRLNSLLLLQTTFPPLVEEEKGKGQQIDGSKDQDDSLKEIGFSRS